MKTEQALQGLQTFVYYVVNVNSTVVFKQQLLFLKIPKISLLWTIWKKEFDLKIVSSFSKSTVQIAMISNVMIKFRSKFQFQIPLQFYRTVEKVETCDGNDQKF